MSAKSGSFNIVCVQLIGTSKTVRYTEQGRSKHLETGPDVNMVKPHPLINSLHFLLFFYLCKFMHKCNGYTNSQLLI